MMISSITAAIVSRFVPVWGGRSLQGVKNLEWIFIGVRGTAVPVTLLMAWMHSPSSRPAMVIVAGLLLICCVIDAILNRRIDSSVGQWRLSVAMLIADAFLAWAALSLFAYDFHTSAYAFFAVIVIEGAMRFGLAGSLIMAVIFALGLYGAMVFRLHVYDVRFSWSGYVFWTSFMTLAAFAVGLIVQEGQRERLRSIFLARRTILLAERQRIAQDLHDTVLKNLQGLAMETYVLGKQVNSPETKGQLQYIEMVCRRSSQEIRDVIHEIRSESEDEGIVSQLTRIVRDWSSDSGIATDITVTGDDRHLPLKISHHLRRVISEALSNVRMHSEAEGVQVSIVVLADEVWLDVHDDGCGIGTAVIDQYELVSCGKFGIVGMKERVEQLNGEFHIEDDRGTRLVFRVPIEPLD